MSCIGNKALLFFVAFCNGSNDSPGEEENSEMIKSIRGMKLQGKDLFNLLNGLQDGTISFVANGESEEETGSFIYNEEREEREEVNYGEMEEY